ncbi:MAG: hypothetical protein DSY59_05505 [Persephonella sp.]|nr:MAG: hypothetical protein DSY59_05505 [Persephonella sp.]
MLNVFGYIKLLFLTKTVLADDIQHTKQFIKIVDNVSLENAMLDVIFYTDFKYTKQLSYIYKILTYKKCINMSYIV